MLVDIPEAVCLTFYPGFAVISVAILLVYKFTFTVTDDWGFVILSRRQQATGFNMTHFTGSQGMRGDWCLPGETTLVVWLFSVFTTTEVVPPIRRSDEFIRRVLRYLKLRYLLYYHKSSLSHFAISRFPLKTLPCQSAILK